MTAPDPRRPTLALLLAVFAACFIAQVANVRADQRVVGYVLQAKACQGATCIARRPTGPTILYVCQAAAGEIERRAIRPRWKLTTACVPVMGEERA